MRTSPMGVLFYAKETSPVGGEEILYPCHIPTSGPHDPRRQRTRNGSFQVLSHSPRDNRRAGENKKLETRTRERYPRLRHCHPTRDLPHRRNTDTLDRNESNPRNKWKERHCGYRTTRLAQGTGRSSRIQDEALHGRAGGSDIHTRRAGPPYTASSLPTRTHRIRRGSPIPVETPRTAGYLLGRKRVCWIHEKGKEIKHPSILVFSS